MSKCVLDSLKPGIIIIAMSIKGYDYDLVMNHISGIKEVTFGKTKKSKVSSTTK